MEQWMKDAAAEAVTSAYSRSAEEIAEIIARHAPPSAPVSEREAVLEEACNVIAYWADTHRGETTYGEAKRVLTERIRALKRKE